MNDAVSVLVERLTELAAELSAIVILSPAWLSPCTTCKCVRVTFLFCLLGYSATENSSACQCKRTSHSLVTLGLALVSIVVNAVKPCTGQICLHSASKMSCQLEL
jgi:hypothetical protein